MKNVINNTGYNLKKLYALNLCISVHMENKIYTINYYTKKHKSSK